MSETSETIALDPTTLEAKVEKSEDKDKDKSIHTYVPYGIISFAELEKSERTERVVEEAKDVIDSFSQIAYNITTSPDIDRETAMNNLVAELQGKMEEINKIQHGMVKETDDADEVSEEDLPSLPATQKSDFTVWKDADGSWKWMTIYSNKFRDSDRVPEIISEKSHQTFEALVDMEIVPPPELWLWHIPGSMWGKSDMVTYSDGFSIAFGTVLPGYEYIAEGLMKAIDEGDDIAVSHGMPGEFIVRNEDDPTIIDFHITREISVLPRSAAANKLTGFVVFKEQGEEAMPIPDEKKEWLLAKFGIDQSAITKLESGLAKQAKAADDAGIESKETEEAEPVAETEVKDEVVAEKEEAPVKTPDAEVDEKVEEETKETETPTEPTPITREEIAEAMNALVGLVKESNEGVSSRLGDIEAQLKELQVADEEKVTERVSQIPSDSVLDLMGMSVIGQSGARVDGRKSLAKEGPEETEAPKVSVTGSPLLDSYMDGAQAPVSE
jgi:uncharacterized FlaG/YvyC family protein